MKFTHKYKLLYRLQGNMRQRENSDKESTNGGRPMRYIWHDNGSMFLSHDTFDSPTRFLCFFCHELSTNCLFSFSISCLSSKEVLSIEKIGRSSKKNCVQYFTLQYILLHQTHQLIEDY